MDKGGEGERKMILEGGKDLKVVVAREKKAKVPSPGTMRVSWLILPFLLLSYWILLIWRGLPIWIPTRGSPLRLRWRTCTRLG